MKAQMPLVHTGKDRIGWMSASHWRETVRILAAENVLSPPVPDIDRIFTTQYLEKVYGGRS